MQQFTFHNRGSITPFNPKQQTKDASGNPVTMLEFHMELVREADRRDVYIVNHKGKDVDCNSTLISLKKVA